MMDEILWQETKEQYMELGMDEDSAEILAYEAMEYMQDGWLLDEEEL